MRLLPYELMEEGIVFKGRRIKEKHIKVFISL